MVVFVKRFEGVAGGYICTKAVASVTQENHSRARMAVALPTGKLLLR